VPSTFDNPMGVMKTKNERELLPIAPGIPAERILNEMKHAEVMVDSTPEKPEKGFFVFRAPGHQIPDTLLEIGRLREETFRTVGEGTGLERDIDRFDNDYDHFICWDKKSREITGAYRIGRMDLILKEKGTDGIYTNTLFNLDEMLKTDFREGTLEAGRSFVRPEYQRGLTLLMIWMGLARFIAANPQYKYLVGPVSISSDFKEDSKNLMVSYLMKYHHHEKSDTELSKNPPRFDSNLSPEELTSLVNRSLNLSSLQEFVRAAEGNPRAQIPQLIKLYLELGVRFLAFNEDKDFNTIDGLIWLDITKIPDNIITRYMGEENWADYSSFHRQRNK
jgi:putative hemolysin